MRRHPTPFQRRTLWNALTGVAMLVLAALVFGLIWTTGKVLGFLQPVVVPLAVAGIIAFLLDPVVRWFQKRGMTRLRAVIATFAVFTLAAAALLAIAIPMVGNQINDFRSRSVPEIAETVDEASSPEKKPANFTFEDRIVQVLAETRDKRPWTQPVIDSLLSPPLPDRPIEGSRAQPRDEITAMLDAREDGDRVPVSLADTTLWETIKNVSDDLLKWIKGGTSRLLGILGLILGFFMVPIYLYYFLKESASIKQHWHEYVPLKASRFKTEVVETLLEINQYLVSFFRGQVLVAFIDGILVGIALTAFGLPLGLLIGLLMAILGIIPYLGNIITLIPACLLAYFHFSDPSHATFLGDNPWAYVLGVIVIFIVVQQINSVLTAPKIVGDSVGLHPMTVIFSMIFWSLILGGFVGALLAVPLTASIKVLFRRYVWEKRLKDGQEEARDEAPPGSDPDPAPLIP